LGKLNTLAAAMSPPIVFGSGLNTGNLNPVNFDTTNGVKDNFQSFLLHDKWATQRRSGNYGRPNTAPF
jgi:hypothetical protein